MPGVRSFNELSTEFDSFPSKLSNIPSPSIGSVTHSPFRPVTSTDPSNTNMERTKQLLFMATSMFFSKEDSEPELAFEFDVTDELEVAPVVGTCQHCMAPGRRCVQCQFCEKAICSTCTFQCSHCHDVFCNLCVTKDYSGLYDETVCMDCRTVRQR